MTPEITDVPLAYPMSIKHLQIAGELHVLFVPIPSVECSSRKSSGLACPEEGLLVATWASQTVSCLSRSFSEDPSIPFWRTHHWAKLTRVQPLVQAESSMPDYQGENP